MIPTQTILTVADVHRSSQLLKELRQAVVRHKPGILALVGDVLHAFADNHRRETTKACAQFLSTLPCPEIIFVRGNHEDSAWLEFAEAWKRSGRPLHALHGEPFVHGPLVLLGFPCLTGDETAYIGNRSPLPVWSDEWLPNVMRKGGRAARTLWLMHEPPNGSTLSSGFGNSDWVTAIERFSPWLTVAGHEHLSPIRWNSWRWNVGRTTCVNVGQTDHGPLHYCVIKTTFASTMPSLPTKMTVTAYPWKWNETVSLPDTPVENQSREGG